MSDAYRRRWSTFLLALAIPVLCFAFVMWSHAGVLVLLLVGFVVSMVGLSAAIENPGALPGSPVALPWRSLVRRALRWAAVADAIAVTAAVSPWLSLLLALAVLASSPWFLDKMPGTRALPSPGAATRSAPLVGDLDTITPEGFRVLVRRLDITGLCWAWRSSHELLDQIHETSARGKVVMMRQEYLDEMERRDATGFAAWLAVSAAADPESYLTDGPGGAAAA